MACGRPWAESPTGGSWRPPGGAGPASLTGAVEVLCTELVVLSEARTPPFEVKDEVEVGEPRARQPGASERRPNHVGRRGNVFVSQPPPPP